MAELWRLRLKREGTFRGVPFKVKNHSFKSGRNTVEHETPGSGKNHAEDMGKKTREFNINAHVIGDDYFRLRDNLVKSLEATGPGELVHPWLGTKNVQVKEFSFNESNFSGGRKADFTIKFVEAGEATFPNSIFEAISQFFDIANNAIDAAKAEFDAIYDLTNVPGFVFDEAVGLSQNFVDTIEDTLEKVTTLPDIKAQIDQSLSNLRLNVNSFITSASDLSTEVISITRLLPDSIVPIEQQQTDPIDTTSGEDQKLTAHNELLVFNDDNRTTPTGSNSNAVQIITETVFSNFIKRVAIVGLAEQTVIKDFKTVEDAEEKRDTLVDLIELQQNETQDDEVFQAFSDLKASVIANVPDEDEDFISEVDIELTNTEPSLVTVYKLSGNIDNNQDFIDRNNIRQPGFVQVGTYKAIA